MPVASIRIHGEFLTMADTKMAKSTGNVVRVADLPDRDYEPLAFRYLALTAHYRSKLDFTEDAMNAASSGLARLRRAVAVDPSEPVDLDSESMARYRARFTDAVADDLRIPRALAVAHEVASSAELTAAQRRALLLDVDRVLGLSLDAPVAADVPLPEGAAELLERRAAARAARDWARLRHAPSRACRPRGRRSRHRLRPGDHRPPLARSTVQSANQGITVDRNSYTLTSTGSVPV